MNLPFILNVLISVVFIYLILSLLASEIQELITTLLQWRAKHLKDSIESLISGGSSQESRKVTALMNRSPWGISNRISIDYPHRFSRES